MCKQDKIDIQEIIFAIHFYRIGTRHETGKNRKTNNNEDID